MAVSKDLLYKLLKDCERRNNWYDINLLWEFWQNFEW
jgi:hypothetical protein